MSGMSKMTRNIVLVAIVVCAGGGAGWWWTHRTPAEGSTLATGVALKTEAARRANVSSGVSASGLVEAVDSATIRAEVSGVVVSVAKREGDSVKAGDILVAFDDTDFRRKLAQCQLAVEAARLKANQAQQDARLYPVQAKSSVDQATRGVSDAKVKLADVLMGSKPQEVAQGESTVRQRQISLAQAKTQYENQKALYDQGAIAKTSLDQARDAMQVAQEQYDSAKQQLSLTKAKAQEGDIASAKAQLRQAQGDLELAKEQAKSNSKLEALAQAQNQLKSAEADLAVAKSNLADTKVTSPIDGIITALTPRQGDTVSVQTELGAVTNPSRLRVKVYVDETDVGRVQVGQVTELTLDAVAEGLALQGQVAVISPEGANNNGVTTYSVLVDFDAQGSPVLPGMNADARIIMESAVGVLAVPSSAIVDNNGRSSLAVLEDGSPSWRRVRTGVVGDDSVEVLSGVSAGEQVITNPSVLTAAAAAEKAGGQSGVL